MNIGFDLDGVLYDWHDVVYRYCVNNCNYTGSFSQFWKDYNSFSDNKKLNFETTPIFFSKKIPSPSMIRFLTDVAKDNTIFYITARKKEVHSATINYLERYKFPCTENLIFAEDKAIYIKLLDIDIFVDDFPTTLDSIGNSADTYLFARPWNESICHDYNCINSIEELRGKIL